MLRGDVDEPYGTGKELGSWDNEKRTTVTARRPRRRTRNERRNVEMSAGMRAGRRDECEHMCVFVVDADMNVVTYVRE